MDRVQFKIEKLFKSSPAMLYKFVTDPAYLMRWFSDEAVVEGDHDYEFTWEGVSENATLIATEDDAMARYRWEDADSEEEMLEFKMYKAGVSEQTVLEVSDYCDEDEIEDNKKLWENQLERLRREIGG